MLSRVKRALAAVLILTSCALLAMTVMRAQSASKSESTEKNSALENQAQRAQNATVAAQNLAKLPATTQGIGAEEAKLIAVYRLIGLGDMQQALGKAEDLVNEQPNFQLAQLIYGDLLFGRTAAAQTSHQPLESPNDNRNNSANNNTNNSASDGADANANAAINAAKLAELRDESRQRLRALRELPQPGTQPSLFLSLAPSVKHAIAIDTGRSRLYLFKNQPSGLQLIAHYYISVGKSGTEKSLEGDLRTPLGIYYVTGRLSPKSLKDFYGAGALPINYPNQLDVKRGKTGSGIWLHGTPPEQFSRAPLATDGCVVLANSDLERISQTVEIRNTPVLIANSLEWVTADSAQADGKSFAAALAEWKSARSNADITRLIGWYSDDFNSYGKTLAQWTPTLQTELKLISGHGVEIKDLSYLRWSDTAETMVVTFGELIQGRKTGHTKRQYWIRENQQWKIFFEGNI